MKPTGDFLPEVPKALVIRVEVGRHFCRNARFPIAMLPGRGQKQTGAPLHCWPAHTLRMGSAVLSQDLLSQTFHSLVFGPLSHRD